MNVLEIVQAERPEVAPLDSTTRQALRHRLFGAGDLSMSPRDDVSTPLGSLSNPPDRRGWLLVAAVLLVAAGLAAVVAVARPGAEAPSAPGASTPEPITQPSDQSQSTIAYTTTTLGATTSAPPEVSNRPGDVALLAPNEVEYAGAGVVSSPGSRTAVVIAPDGSMQIIWLTTNDATVWPPPDKMIPQRTYSDRTVLAFPDGLYDIVEHPCWLLRVADGGSFGAASSDEVMWRPTIAALFESMSASAPGVSFTLPKGWTVLADTGPAVAYETQFRLDGTSDFIDMYQSPGSSAAHHLLLASRQLERVPFLDGEAWAGITSFDPIVNTVFWERDGSTFSAQSETLDVGQIERAVVAMHPITLDEWERLHGPVDAGHDEIEIATDCAPPELVITTG